MADERFFPESCRYTDEHLWVRRDGAHWVIGVTDHAQDALGEVLYVDLPAVGDRFETGAGFGTIESAKSVNTLFMPVSGEVVAVNEALDATPSLVNAGCYTSGWLIRIAADHDEDVDSLLPPAAYGERVPH